MGLAHPRGADEYHILIAFDKAQPGQLLELAPFHALSKVIIEVVQRLDRRKAGQAREHVLLAHVANQSLCLE